MKARMISYEEVISDKIGCEHKVDGSCPKWMYINLRNTGDNNTLGYWTSTSGTTMENYAMYVHYSGDADGFTIYANNRSGVRPVIELNKY